MSHPILFGAIPIGRGQGNVESLSGFFARICLSRFVTATRFLCEFVVVRCSSDLFPSSPLRIGTFLSRSSARFDLRPDRALPFASALEDLTCLPDLHALTFSACVPLVDPASLRRLGVHRKRWCPACLADWEAEGVPVHEPLLWRFALVERCPVHRLSLLERCPCCDRFQPLITQEVPIGYCVRCGHALHHGALLSLPGEASLDLSDRWTLWRSVALSRLLAWSSTLDRASLIRLPVSSREFPRLLEHALKSLPDRSRLTLACDLGLVPKSFYRLLSGELRPSLPDLLDTCMMLGVEPLQLVRGDFREGEQSWPPDGPELLPCTDPWHLALEVRESGMARRYPARVKALDAFIANPCAVDLAGLMRAQHTTPSSLSLAFPLRHARARELRAKRLAGEREAITGRFNAVLDMEIATGAPRSLSDIAVSFGVPLASLTYYSPERSAQLVALRESSFSTRDPGLLDRIRAALLAALEVPEGPTAHEVSRSLGVEDFVVVSLCPDEYRLLVDLRDRERKARHAGYAATMRDELARPHPRGITFVADRLGICAATLKRADSGLYAQLCALPSERAQAEKRRRESGVLGLPRFSGRLRAVVTGTEVNDSRWKGIFLGDR